MMRGMKLNMLLRATVALLAATVVLAVAAQPRVAQCIQDGGVC